MLANKKNDMRRQEYMRIIQYACGQTNDETYASMLSSWQMNMGIMPENFGLDFGEFSQLLAFHFNGLNPVSINIPARKHDQQRNDERNDVYQLLIEHRAQGSISEVWMAKIVAAACQRQDHLWQDMGLWSRDQLSQLLMNNFPALASQNTNNMKWKKFLYKQLCNREGVYACRAPSCEVCVDYAQCFGPER